MKIIYKIGGKCESNKFKSLQCVTAFLLLCADRIVYDIVYGKD